MTYAATSPLLSTPIMEELALVSPSGTEYVVSNGTLTLIETVFTMTPVNQSLSSTEMEQLEISPVMSIVISVCVITLSLLIVCGNALVIHTVRMEKSLHTVGNCFIVSLAVSDLLVGLFALPFNIVTYLPNNAFPHLGDVGTSLRDVWITLDYLLSSVTILNQVMLNLDRFWSITSPIRYMRKRTKRRAFFQILAIWIFAMLWVLIPAIGWHAFFPSVSHEPRTHDVLFNDSAWFMLTSAVVIFFIPLFVMFGIYVRIFVEINRRSKMAVGRSSRGSTISRKNSEIPGLTSQELEKLRAIYRKTRRSDSDGSQLNGHVRGDVSMKMVRYYSSINEETSEELDAAEKPNNARNNTKTIGIIHENDGATTGERESIEAVQTKKLTCLEEEIDRYNIANELLNHIPNVQIFNEMSSQDEDRGLEMKPILSETEHTVIIEPDDKVDEGVGDDDDLCSDEGDGCISDDDVFIDGQSNKRGEMTVFFKPVQRQCPSRTYSRIPVHDYCVWIPRTTNGVLDNTSVKSAMTQELVPDSAPSGSDTVKLHRNVKSETSLLDMKKRIPCVHAERHPSSNEMSISSISKPTTFRSFARSYSQSRVLDAALQRKDSVGSAIHSKLRSVSFSKSSFSSSFSGAGGRGSSVRLQLSQQAKAAKQLGIIMACFLLCWLPYFVQVVIIAVCPGCYNLSLLQIAVYLGYLNSLCNTFLYAMCNAKFRKSLKNKLLSRCCQTGKLASNLPNSMI
ncbi:histamine H1 receptor-like [Saccoglossus kowalevskii]